MKFIIGIKLGMSQIFDETGKRIPVTLIEAGPCYVTQIKQKQAVKEGKNGDGYEALQLGFQALKDSKVKKPLKAKPYRRLKEFKGEIDIAKYKVGDKIDVSSFNVGDKVSVSGISKGKGFAGMIKRWGASRKPTTHGAKHQTRAMGSVGCRFPQRVVKGRKMPGRLGAERVTISDLKIVKIDKENNILAVKGAVPGRTGITVEVRG